MIHLAYVDATDHFLVNRFNFPARCKLFESEPESILSRAALTGGLDERE